MGYAMSCGQHSNFNTVAHSPGNQSTLALSIPPLLQAENVQVVIRMRPKSSAERGQPSLVSIASSTAVIVEPAPAQLEKMGIQNKASLSSA